MKNKYLIGLLLGVGVISSLILVSSVFETAILIKKNKQFEEE